MILYRLLSPLIGLAFMLRGLWAVVRKDEVWRDLRERMIGVAVDGPVIWVHGASVGEMNAAKPVITALAQDHRLLVTATTLTGRATVKAWGIPMITASLAPVDWRWVTRRLLRRAQVKALIIIENELWPNRIITAHDTQTPVMMINARMSASSARTWGRVSSLAQRVLRDIRLIVPQDAQSGERLVTLGAEPARLAPPLNLKGLYAPNFSAIAKTLQRFVRGKTILAAATHAGEDETILAAFGLVRQSMPDAQLILAPRHPARGADIAQLVKDMGFTLAYRSRDDLPETDVFLADTLGEMHLWYRLAGVAFIGGSLVDKGGHTPFEPAAYGCPIVHGPHLRNFADSYAQLGAARGAIQITDAATLAQAALQHLEDDAMAQRAAKALAQPDLAPLLLRIQKVLDPSL